jgi:hypothetical protein
LHHGAQTALWMLRWRQFFLAAAGLFGFSGGSEWNTSHYRMKVVVRRCSKSVFSSPADKRRSRGYASLG